jgi:hypothetical protein
VAYVFFPQKVCISEERSLVCFVGLLGKKDLIKGGNHKKMSPGSNPDARDRANLHTWLKFKE